MPRFTPLWALPVLASHALAQPALYGVRGNGDLLRINTVSGAGVFVGNSGVECRGAVRALGFVTQGVPPEFVLVAGPADQLFRLAPWSGQVLETYTIPNRPPGYSIHGMAPGYLILGADDPSAIDLLATIDSSGFVVIGPTGRADLESLAIGPDGFLYALGTDGGGGLFRMNTSTGAATFIGGGGFGDARALGAIPYETLVACGSSLFSVNAATGTTTLIGPTGFSDVRGLAFVHPCYADCAAGGWPQLNVQDFGCFLNRFAAGDPYANCDGSTIPPVLNVLDFLCFINSFTGGCQ